MLLRWLCLLLCLVSLSLAGCTEMRQAGAEPRYEKPDTGGGGYSARFPRRRGRPVGEQGRRRALSLG
jgi:hypothetical protein